MLLNLDLGRECSRKAPLLKGVRCPTRHHGQPTVVQMTFVGIVEVRLKCAMFLVAHFYLSVS